MIKMFVMDVDGTLTDGNVYFGVNGEIFKKFNVKDGYGIKILNDYNIIPVIISGRESEIVLRRFNELGVIEIHLGIEDKYAILRKVCVKYDIELSEVSYVGDDENDLLCMSNVGYPYAVKNSIQKIKNISKYISKKYGGNGAVRDIIDLVLVEMQLEKLK